VINHVTFYIVSHSTLTSMNQLTPIMMMMTTLVTTRLM